ncbi:MAG: CbtA family protein [bacterium]
MLKKVISVALLSGFIAGLFVTVIQSVLVTPLILEAESYEQSASAFRLPDSGEKPWRLIGHEWKHDEGEDSTEWFPDEGLERTFYTAGSNIVTGVAFALVLVGVFLLRDKPVDLNQGFLWGAAGFVVFSAAPALGLPPELPGMTAATLGSRQLWWFGTVFVTAVGFGNFHRKKLFVAQTGGIAPDCITAPAWRSSCCGHQKCGACRTLCAVCGFLPHQFGIVLDGSWRSFRIFLPAIDAFSRSSASTCHMNLTAK